MVLIALLAPLSQFLDECSLFARRAQIQKPIRFLDFEYADGRMPVAMTSAGQVYYLGYDQVGSLKVVTDAAGTVVKRVDYDSFGNILSDSNPSFTAPFGFAGGLHDKDTGLVRFGARDYDPATGKWTAKDPIDFWGGDLSLYAYSLLDPVNNFDANGFSAEGLLLGSVVGTALADIFGIEWLPCTFRPFKAPLHLYLGVRGALYIPSLGAAAVSVPIFGPVMAVSVAGLTGWLIGSGINDIYEAISGDSLGEDLYDWLYGQGPYSQYNPSEGNIYDNWPPL